VRSEVEGGQPFDVGLSQADIIDYLVKDGKIDPATRADLVRIGLAIAVRAGAPKPDVASVEAFKRTLLSAKSIGVSPGSASSAHLAALLERFGIVAQVKPKIITPPINRGGAFGLVARGEAEIGLAASDMVPGTELVGFPTELQLYQVFAGGVASSAKEPEAAKELVRFLASERSASALKAHGMEPAASRPDANAR
jgi:molybdate transport system substrate-binding protein